MSCALMRQKGKIYERGSMNSVDRLWTDVDKRQAEFFLTEKKIDFP